MHHALRTALDVQRLFIELKDCEMELGEVVHVCLWQTSNVAVAYGAARYEPAIVCRFESSTRPEDDALLVLEHGAIVLSCSVLPRFMANPYVRDWPSTTLDIYMFNCNNVGAPRPTEVGIKELIGVFV